MRSIFSLGHTRRVIALGAITAFVFFLVFAALPTHAADTGLVQCGRQFFEASSENTQFCTICDLISLAQNLMNKAITFFAAPIAALMLGYGGFLMVIAGVRGGSSQQFTQGKKVLTNAVIGIVILFTAWLMVDTLLKSIGYSKANFGPWNVITCESPAISEPSHFACNGNKCEKVKGFGGSECTVGGARNNCVEHAACNTTSRLCEVKQGKGQDDCSTDNGGADSKCASSDMCKGIECLDAGINTCAPAPSADCSIVGNWERAISDGISKAGAIGGGIDTYKMVKAIISQESHGRIDIPSSAGACGLMQIKPSSGKRFANRCGTTEAEASKCAFYSNPANAAKSICIGTLLLGAPEVVSACGRTIRGLAAGFNGGGGGSKDACAPSVDCGPAAGVGECKVCGGQTSGTKRWECLWEDPNHVTCNVGLPSNYSETRKYVPKVWNCYNQF